MSEYLSDTDVGHRYFRENEESEQHRLRLKFMFSSLVSFWSFHCYLALVFYNLSWLGIVDACVHACS